MTNTSQNESACIDCDQILTDGHFREHFEGKGYACYECAQRRYGIHSDQLEACYVCGNQFNREDHSWYRTPGDIFSEYVCEGCGRRREKALDLQTKPQERAGHKVPFLFRHYVESSTTN